MTLERPLALDDVPARRPAPGDRTTTVLFALTSFWASGLLFAVQPMVARLLLPRLGGSAAVWNTAMVFFQATLLVGYLVAHIGLRHLPMSLHRFAHLGLLLAAAAVLPVAVPSSWAPPDGDPVAWTFLVLAVVVGLPFLALSTMSPTLQRWLAATDHPSGHDPYFLYGAGNAGSFLALLAYPLLLEPAAGVTAQTRWWATAYGVLVVLTAACALTTHLRRRPATAADAAVATGARSRPTPRQAMRWTAVAAVPSALLLGVTRHLATDVASIPLLWVVPLAIYLLTFVVAFSPRRPRLGPRAAAVATVLAVPALLGWAGPVLGASIGHAVVGAVALAAFAAVSLAAHRRLWDERPPAEDLTSFYVWVSVGGVVGGAAAALVAPVVFDSVVEFPLALAAGIAVLPAATADPGRRAVLVRMAVGVAGALLLVTGSPVGALGIAVWAGAVFRRSPKAGAVVLVAVVALVTTVGTPGLLRRDRTFYGVSQVHEEHGARVLQSGTTVHGVQRIDPARAGEPLAYYTRSGPIGQLFDLVDARDVGVVGLGAGSLAAYAGPGDHLTFYEIDPAVVAIAQDPALFTYLSDAAGTVDVQVGDGRLLLDRAGGRRHDVLVLDAFSSDAIPLHLLTREAFAVYGAHLADGGALAIHVSSRFFDLAPQVAALAADAGLRALQLEHDAVTDPLAQPSHWVVATADEGLLDALVAAGWTPPEAADDVWTDDHADLLATLRLAE
jgi:hypothetical protein